MSGDMEPNLGPMDDQAEIEQILSKVDSTTFEEKDWNIVIMKCRSLSANWEQLSGYIGLSFNLIDSVKGNHPANNLGCWNEALKEWIKQNYDTEKFGKPSWKMLLKAIAFVDKRLFKVLAADHQTDAPPSPKRIKIEPSFTFPLLDLKKMDKDEKELLHQRLFAESENMEDKFQLLFKATRTSLVERKIAVGGLLKHLDCLGSIKPLYKGSELPVFGRQLPRLRETESVENAMSVISSYCSFFNYRIVECIIENLGTEQDKTNLRKYKEEFSVYAQRHVFECPAEVGEIDEEAHANMFVTLDATYDSYTVSHLYAFVSNLQKVLKIPAMSLRLCRIGPGSLKLTFQLSLSILHSHSIFPLSSDQEAALAYLSVMLLSCGRYLFNQQDYAELSGDVDTDHTDSEGSIDSLDSRDAELVSMAADLAEKRGDTFSISADSALGRSSIISDTTAGITQFSEDIADRDLEDFSMVTRRGPVSFQLCIAAQNGELQEVMRLVEEENFSPSQMNEYGENALHCAAARGYLDVLRYFIEDRGYNAACSDQGGWTPLHHAARHKHLHVVQYLIGKQMVEPLSRNDRGQTALHQACAGGSINVIHYLAKEMSKYLPLKDVVHDEDMEGKVPMHWAAMFGCLEAIKLLVTKLNCDPCITDSKRRTCVHTSVQEGHLPVVKYFIEEQHCDPFCLTVDSLTPLHYAAMEGHLDITKYLALEQHHDPMCTSKYNDIPLHLAAKYGRLQVVRFFIEVLHCPTDIGGWNNETPLEQARSKGHHHVVKYIVKSIIYA